MDLNQDASRNEDKMSIFTEESKKYNLGENAIIFDERVKDKTRVISVTVDTIFWLNLETRQPVLSAFIVLTAEVAKVI